ncbi:MAG: DUF302 domain-containing protein [Bacteroidales bacterium]|nr:DUF302 domain-containing protein [Bacteroidales bacterium]
MKNNNVKSGRIVLFAGGILTGIIITLIILIAILKQQMFVVYESKFDFDKTVNTITESAEDHKWSVQHSYDIQASLDKHGYTVQPVKVFSLCKPEHASKILVSGEERIVSALMPCRISVYEDDGTVYISMLNSGLFSRFLGKEIKNVMGKASSENKQILEPVIK